jgi:hypothetical protein
MRHMSVVQDRHGVLAPYRSRGYGRIEPVSFKSIPPPAAVPTHLEQLYRVLAQTNGGPAACSAGMTTGGES